MKQRDVNHRLAKDYNAKIVLSDENFIREEVRKEVMTYIAEGLEFVFDTMKKRNKADEIFEEEWNDDMIRQIADSVVLEDNDIIWGIVIHDDEEAK